MRPWRRGRRRGPRRLRSAGDERRPGRAGAEAGTSRPIRDWSKAVNAERYERAASFFAPGAIVDQGREFRLENRAGAVAFNRSLPCKADVTDVDGEGETCSPRSACATGPAAV